MGRAARDVFDSESPLASDQRAGRDPGARLHLRRGHREAGGSELSGDYGIVRLTPTLRAHIACALPVARNRSQRFAEAIMRKHESSKPCIRRVLRANAAACALALIAGAAAMAADQPKADSAK